MPRVPIVEGQRVQSTPLQGGFRQAPDAQAHFRALAGGLSAVSDAAAKIVDRENRDVAFKAETAIKTEFMRFEADLRKQSQGRNAIGYADKIDAWWKEQAAKAGGALAPAQRDLIKQSLATAQMQSVHAARQYQDGELERSEAESYASSQLAEIQRAAASGDPAVAAVSSELLRKRNAERAAVKGWSPETLAAANTKDTTALHVHLLQELQQRDPAAAAKYFEANKGEIDGTRHAEIAKSLKAAVAADEGDRAAGDAWKSLGPKGPNDPVALDKLEAKVREQFANDEPRRKAALAGLRERASAHNMAQAESNAAAVNDAMAVYNRTKSLAAVQRSPAWAALPPAKQTEIENHIVAMQTAVLNRAYVQEQRAFTAEGRVLQQMQREQMALRMKGFASYLEYSDPQKLAGMSEAQIRALLPTLGNELTEHLLSKKQSLAAKKGPGEAEAKIDLQDFNHIANRMGLKPFDPKKSEEERAHLGELQYRVEQLIYAEQLKAGKPLTREQKMKLMQEELSRTVTTGGFLGFFTSDKPVLQLSDKEVEDVVVPQGDRAQIVEAMKVMYERTQSPLYAPTDANVRRFYLLNKSPRAAALLAPEPAK